jgi:hypothetical protein
MIQFSDREIVNEQLVLDSKTELYYLGHDLTLRQCTLVLKVPARALVITRTQLIDCTIHVKQEFRRARELSAAPWPSDIGSIVMSSFDQDPPTTVAVTYSAPALAKRYGTTPEAIRATLEKLDGVRY